MNQIIFRGDKTVLHLELHLL